MTTYEDLLKEFFHRYPDDLYDKNWKNLYDDVFKDMKHQFTEKSDFTSAPLFYCKLLSSLFEPNELLQLKGKLSFPLLAYSAYLAKIPELNISLKSDVFSQNIYGKNEIYFDYIGSSVKFKKICLTLDESWDGFSGLNYLYIYSDVLELSFPKDYNLSGINIGCKTLVIKDNAPQNLNITKISANGSTVKKCILDSNLTELPKSGNLYGAKEIYLPNNISTSLPRWISRTADSDCKIYKKKGQKLQVYKNEIPWYKEHLVNY